MKHSVRKWLAVAPACPAPPVVMASKKACPAVQGFKGFEDLDPCTVVCICLVWSLLGRTTGIVHFRSTRCENGWSCLLRAIRGYAFDPKASYTSKHALRKWLAVAPACPVPPVVRTSEKVCLGLSGPCRAMSLEGHGRALVGRLGRSHQGDDRTRTHSQTHTHTLTHTLI